MLNARLIRVWLAEQNQSQAWLARKAGIGLATLSRAMQGSARPRLATIRMLSHITGIAEEALMSDATQEGAVA
ncbi:MAG: hypothetical protein AMXMBFR33_01880 [Candidatus Xenobia bacterium]